MSIYNFGHANTKPLTNELMAELLRPVDARLVPQIGAFDSRLVDEEAQAEVDRAIAVFARSMDWTPLDEMSLSAKAALRHRILISAASAAIAPNEAMLEIPQDSDESQMRTFSIIALHRHWKSC